MAKIKGKQIESATILDANISGSAAIALSKLAEAVLQADGGQALTGNLPAGSNKITGLADPAAAQDAATKAYVDAAIVGLSWADPVATKELVGNLGEVAIEALSPTQGDAYVVSAEDGDSTIDGTAAAVGDIFEYNGTVFVKVVTNSGGFPPAGTRALASIQTALVSPYTDATDDGKVLEFDGASLTATATGEGVDGAAVLVNGEGADNENAAFVYDGAVPTGSWVQFTGSGSITFGTAVALGAANSAGSGTDSARANHVHKRDTYSEEAIATEAITGTDTAMSATLASTPLAGSLSISLNGLEQLEGAGNDYTVSGTTITWLASSGSAVDQETSDTMIAKYVSQG